MSNARKAAAETVLAVCAKGESLDIALETNRSEIQAQEYGLHQEIAYGSIRWYPAYLAYLTTKLKKPFKPKDKILEALLVTALYQIDYTSQAPHAVVSESVNLVARFNRQWARGLVNAILRAHLRVSAADAAFKQKSWLKHSFPAWLFKQIQSAWPEHIDTILLASQSKPPMTLRVNHEHYSRSEYLEVLNHAQIQAQACIDSESGLTLAQPVSVESLPGFNQASVSVQDESAQLAVKQMKLEPGQRVLDACAAPGGKSLHILQDENQLEELVVLDLEPRLPRLRENLERAKRAAIVIEGDLLEAKRWWDKRLFDRILLDVPCTGTGVIRRHPDIKLRRQPQNTLQFALNQLKFLEQAWRLLKPGGILLYTTCSILPNENEDNTAQFVRQTPSAQALELPDSLGLQTGHGRQRLPGVHAGDGFYYALLQKNEL